MIGWPFQPDWGSPYVERYSYLTEVLVSDAGREQRRAYRGTSRRSLEYDIRVHGDRFRALRRTLATRQGEPLAFANERFIARSATGQNIGSANVTLAGSIPPWATSGRRVLIRDLAGLRAEGRTVHSTSGTTITFTGAATEIWPEGSTLHPGFIGTLAQSLTHTAPTSEVLALSVALDIEPGSTVDLPGVAPTTFASREVLSHRPNWASALSMEATDPTVYVDQGMGVRATFRPIDFGTTVRRQTHVIQNDADLNATLGLFQRMKGRRGEFYAPTHTRDIVLSGNVASGSRDWPIAGLDFHAAYAGDTVHRAFQVRLRSGAIHYFRVDQVLTSGSNSILRSVEAAPITFSPSAIQSISWMPVCRFASDDLVVSWRTSTIGETTLNIQTLETLS
jgi:hypothetical protein